MGCYLHICIARVNTAILSPRPARARGHYTREVNDQRTIEIVLVRSIGETGATIIAQATAFPSRTTTTPDPYQLLMSLVNTRNKPSMCKKSLKKGKLEVDRHYLLCDWTKSLTPEDD